MNVTTLGAFDAETDKAYYLQVDGGAPVEMVFDSEVNQAVQIYRNESLGDGFDYRNFFVIYLRIQGKTYAFYDLIAEQNIEALTYQRYAMPLSNAIDLNIEADDNDIETDPAYTNMSITFHTTPVKREIGEEEYDFSIVIDGNGESIQKIYEFVQWSLRQNTNINDGVSPSVLGLTADDMLQFVGPTLFTLYTSYNGGSGVFIENFDEVDTNDIRFRHDGSATEVVRFPFVAAGRINFNDNLTNAEESRYVMFFTTGFDTVDATIVEDANENSVTGSPYGLSDVVFTYDYDGNIQRGVGTAGTDAPVTVVAIGTFVAQYVRATGIIAESTQNVITLVAPLERNYRAN